MEMCNRFLWPRTRLSAGMIISIAIALDDGYIRWNIYTHTQKRKYCARTPSQSEVHQVARSRDTSRGTISYESRLDHLLQLSSPCSLMRLTTPSQMNPINGVRVFFLSGDWRCSLPNAIQSIAIILRCVSYISYDDTKKAFFEIFLGEVMVVDTQVQDGF